MMSRTEVLCCELREAVENWEEDFWRAAGLGQGIFFSVFSLNNHFTKTPGVTDSMSPTFI